MPGHCQRPSPRSRAAPSTGRLQLFPTLPGIYQICEVTHARFVYRSDRVLTDRRGGGILTMMDGVRVDAEIRSRFRVRSWERSSNGSWPYLITFGNGNVSAQRRLLQVCDRERTTESSFLHRRTDRCSHTIVGPHRTSLRQTGVCLHRDLRLFTECRNEELQGYLKRYK